MNENENIGSSNILRNKSYSLKKLEITNWNTNKAYDLRYVFTELNIYSSLNDIMASGDVTISEQGNLISLAPLDGREFIEIEFCSLDEQYEPYHRIFFVYAIDNIIEKKDVRTYTIRFTDVFGKVNLDMRLSIKYENKIEDIIKNIKEITENPEMEFEVYKQILNNHDIYTKNVIFPFVTENELSISTEYKMKFVVPYWHPLKFIKYIVDRSISTDCLSLQEDKFTDCLFFQNRNGEYILTNYKKMFNTPLSTKYSKNISFKKVIGNTENSNNGFLECKYAVQSFGIKKIFNDQIEKQIGFFGFTDFITDFVNAKCEPVSIKNDEIQSCISRYGLSLSKQYPYETLKKTENGVFYYDSCGMNMSHKEDEYNKFTLPHLKGYVIRKYLEYAKVIVEMNGVSDIDIGKYVYIDLGHSVDNSISQYINGTKWIISKYAHRLLSNGTYSTVVECFTPYINREHDTGYNKNVEVKE